MSKELLTAEQCTTGETFGALFRELTGAGVPEGVAGEIVLRAASEEIRDSGYSIRKESANV